MLPISFLGRTASLCLVIFQSPILGSVCLAADTLPLELRYQQPTAQDSGRFHRLVRQEAWDPERTAVILCDVWDSHHSVNAVRRVLELAPRIDQFAKTMRTAGATVIHAPSDCMRAYQDHPARLRAQQALPADSFPADIDTWCHQIPGEQQAVYPLDQSDGGEDDDSEELRLWSEQLLAQGRKPRSPWLKQVPSIHIDPELDFISDSGSEIWNVLASRQITNVMLVGVHTNMCVLGRPFGLRRMATAGKNVVLVRDLTDTMYDPRDWPYVNHFSGTDLIVSHIERHVCPTICSSQVLGGNEFRFSKDLRPQLTMIIADDEYKTEETLPLFAAKHLNQTFRVTIAYGSDRERHRILSLEDVQSADALLISVRRRWLPTEDLALLRQFVAAGKPMIGIRTASHAFSMRSGNPPEGYAQWPEFDAEVWGGNYTNHYGNQLRSTLELSGGPADHPILQALGAELSIQPGGSLYKAGPLAPGANALVFGSVPKESPEPVAWTYVRPDGGRSFYTSLGHVNDFAQPQFETLLAAGIYWACELSPPDLDSVQRQNALYNAHR